MSKSLFKFLKISTIVVSIVVPTQCALAQAGPYAGRSVNAGSTAAPGGVNGKLVDAKNQPMSYASVTLMRKDSSVVSGDLSQDDGSFSISSVPAGDYLLRVEAVGVKTKFTTVSITAENPIVNVGKIKIQSSETSLKEVSVVGERPVMELKVDKKVFNVEKNTTTAGGSAGDVLQNVPSVSVDADGNVSLRGKSDVTILIDGKPSTLLGSDVASALQALPASSIESVEVITNPSAKYDAQGTTGIINIITKKDGRFGMNGNITLGAGTNDKYNGNFGINARKGKWNVFLNSSARINNTWNDVTTDRHDALPTAAGDTQSYHTFEHVPRKHSGVFNTIGASYDPNKYNSFTLTENVNIMQFGFTDASNYSVLSHRNESGDTLMKQYRYTDFSVNLVSLSSALDYKHKFKKKDEELSVDATYSTTDIRRKQDYTTTNFDNGSALANIYQHSPATGTNSSFNAWADYTDPLFTKNGKLGLGVKAQVNWFNSNNNPTVESNGSQPVFDSTLYSDYNYTQRIYAAYANWSDQLGKFSYQVGLRAEDAMYDGYGRVPAYASFQNSFFNFFPSAFISYQLPNQQSIYLNYSRRTNRPGFMQLLPFKDLSNPGTVNMGNPALIPEFINNIEFSYSKSSDKGNTFILSAYYAYTENLTQKITRPMSDSEAKLYGVPASDLFAQPINIASGATYGLEGTGHVQILPIWDATLNLNFFENQLIIGNANPEYTKYLSDNSGFTWFGKVNTSVKLPMNFTLQINGNYESPKVIAQGNLKETYWVDVALKKGFWKNKATLILNCSDIFNTHTLVTNYNLSAYSETINRVRETRIGNITFTYRFGKSDIGKGGPGGKRGKSMDDKKPQPPTDSDREKNLKEGDDGGDQGGGGQGGQKNGGGGNGGGGHN